MFSADEIKKLILIEIVLITRGAFHLDKISGISGSAVNGTRFVRRFVHWKIPRKSGKFKKMGLFSRLGFPNGTSFSVCTFLVVCTSSTMSTVGYSHVPGVYDQMEPLFTNRKFHFCSHRNFRDFFLNGKRPRWICKKIEEFFEFAAVAGQELRLTFKAN